MPIQADSARPHAGSALRILLVADLHYTLPQLDWVVRAAPDFDVVVMAGDHLDISSNVPLDAQCVVIERYVAMLRDASRVIVSSGNHDLTGPDEAGEQAALWLQGIRAHNVWTDGDSFVVDDTLVTVCPWWDGDIGKAAVEAQFARDAERRPSRWVWVYHWPPTGSPTCWTGRQHYGDEHLARWVEEYEPDAVLAGHVHQPPFRHDGAWADRVGRTWIFNPGRQIGRQPARIEIDFDEGWAAWISSLGVEEQTLSDLVAATRRVF